MAKKKKHKPQHAASKHVAPKKANATEPKPKTEPKTKPEKPNKPKIKALCYIRRANDRVLLFLLLLSGFEIPELCQVEERAEGGPDDEHEVGFLAEMDA